MLGCARSSMKIYDNPYKITIVLYRADMSDQNKAPRGPEEPGYSKAAGCSDEDK